MLLLNAGTKDENIKISESIIRASIETPLPLTARVGYEGDSQIDDRMPWALNCIIGGRGYLPVGANQGTGGEEAWEMIDQLPDVIAKQFDVIFLNTGANGLRANVSGQTIYENTLKLARSYRQSGYTKYVFIFKCPRSFVGNSLTEIQEQERQTLNSLLDTIDEYGVFVEYDVDYITNEYLSDGLHFHVSGAWRRLMRSAHVFRGLFVPIPSISNPLTNDNILYTENYNPELTGTGGETNPGSGMITGVVPDGWYLTHDNGLAIDIEILENYFREGLNAVKITASGMVTDNNTSSIKFKRRYSVTMNGLAGDAFEAFCEFKLQEGHSGLSNFRIEFPTLTTLSSWRAEDFNSGMGNGAEMSGVLRSEQTGTLNTDTANAQFEYFLRIAQGVPVNFSIIIGTPVLRKVPDIGA